MKQPVLIIGLFAALAPACYKYLDKAHNPSLAVPRTVQELQQLLDNNLVNVNSSPGLGHLGTDDYYYTDSTYRMSEQLARNAYIWQPDIYAGDGAPSWGTPYQVVYQCNVVLDALPTIAINTTADEVLYKVVRGTALFTRCFQFYYLEETYGQPYKPDSAVKDWGLLLRLVSDPHQKVGRSTVQQTFEQMIRDLHTAFPLLPDTISYLHRNRPCKAAAFALLSRIYLTMQQYDSAGRYADSSLHYYSRLIDYNTIDTSLRFPFPITGNDEVLYQCTAVSLPGQTAPAMVDTNLYRSYDENDLRKKVFFTPAKSAAGWFVKGGYSGSKFLFSGVAVDEMFLTRAECFARNGDKDNALQVLNSLLRWRWKTGSFRDFVTSTADQALALILTERRKETLYRETRWADLRRLNQDQRFANPLRRIINGQVYILRPGDPKYAYPIPEEEVRQDGIIQNPQ